MAIEMDDAAGGYEHTNSGKETVSCQPHLIDATHQ